MLIIIYIDLIILINFIIDMLLLISVDMLLKRRAEFKNIIISALVGSISTLSLFYFKSGFVLMIFKLVISTLMVLIAFKYESFKYFKDNLVWLYVIGIILAGTIYLFNNQIALVNNGLVFSKNGFSINLIMLLIISPLIVYKYFKLQRGFKNDYLDLYDVEIYYEGYKLIGTGFLDTGNKLKDPYFGRPIILVNKDLITRKVKSFLVPYHTVNNESLLKVFKPDKVIINKKKVRKVLVGLTDVNLNGVKIILHTEAL